MTTYPRRTWADGAPFTKSMRVETKPDVFIDYFHTPGAWRQKTKPMTAAESVNPARHWLHDWRTPASEWPAVEADMGAWLDTTYEQIGAGS